VAAGHTTPETHSPRDRGRRRSGRSERPATQRWIGSRECASQCARGLNPLTGIFTGQSGERRTVEVEISPSLIQASSRRSRVGPGNGSKRSQASEGRSGPARRPVHRAGRFRVLEKAPFAAAENGARSGRFGVGRGRGDRRRGGDEGGRTAAGVGGREQRSRFDFVASARAARCAPRPAASRSPVGARPVMLTRVGQQDRLERP